MENSFWYDKLLPNYPALKGDVCTDVAIVGGGLAGLTAAYELLKRGKSVCILEGALIGSGETGRSSAMVSFAHDIIYDRLIKKHGEDVARRDFEASYSGAEKIERIIRDNNIDCAYTKCDFMLFSRKKSGVKKLIKEREAYALFDIKTELTYETELPFPVRAALKIKDQAALNPYLYLTGLARAVEQLGGKIYENTFVCEQPQEGLLKVGGFTVKAESFIISTHYPVYNIPGFYFIKMYQHRSFNVVFDCGKQLKNLYEEVEDSGFEYRGTENKILCGGANIRTGKYKHESQFKKVERQIERDFQCRKIVSRFAAQDCMTFDMLPFAGKYGDLDNVYLITGFNKWGFTNSVAAAEIVADLIAKKHGKNIFDTHRAYLMRSPLKFAANTGELLSDFGNLLINADAKKLSRIGAGQGAVTVIKGKRLGVYRDEEGVLHAISAVCPHLGCNLKWNKDERTWDCPCHGSRFGVDGQLINNPSLKNAEKAEVVNRHE